MSDVSSVSSSAASVQQQAQVAVIKKTQELEQKQVEKLLQAVPEPRKPAPGEPGSNVNIFV